MAQWAVLSSAQKSASRPPLRVAAVQATSVAGDIDANAATAAAFVRRAGAAGARLAVFPEKFLTGYEPELVTAQPDRHAVHLGDPRYAPIADACRENGVAAVVGTALHDRGRLTISALVIAPTGALAGHYDKQYLFGSERRHFEPGTGGCTVVLDNWRLGLGICYDSGFPEHARAAAQHDCDAYLVGALFSVGNGHHESRTWFPARALDNTMYTLMSNHVGAIGGWNACGSSAVWGPDGRLVAEADTTSTTMVVADLDPGVLRDVRAAHPQLADYQVTQRARAHHTLALLT
ncbi:carbon-nitrogen hydrolase family protein [Krasilnikovia sp. MM14-A1259]|uniref:carbon-nitrogen hydrolase family protein n=1 Tax=Krasilnikovia sp. MM14-A1259 TaxID=3373539 RepID=UPI00382E93EF